MAYKKQPNQNSKPNQQIKRTKFFPSYQINRIKQNKEREKEYYIPESHKSVIHKKYWPVTLADTIGIGMLVVTAALMWFTYGLYKSATDDSITSQSSASAANKSATIAQQTFEASKRYNDSSLRIQKQIFDETHHYNVGSLDIQQKSYMGNNKDSKERFIRDTTALGLQIKALKQNQAQFIKQNEPYLQVYIDSMKITANNTIDVFYTIVNLTPISVKIITHRSAGTVWNSPPFPITADKMPGSADNNYYVIKESPQSRKFSFPVKYDDKVIQDIKNGTMFFYWISEIKYQNLISQKMKSYLFEVKLTKLKNGATYTDFISNDNSEEK